MTETFAKFSIGYIVLCEWLLGVLLSLGFFFSWKEAFQNQNDMKAIDGTLCCVALICFAAGWGLIKRKRWGWFISFLLGLAIAVFGIEGIHQSMGSDRYARMEGGFLFGSGLILLVVATIGLLLLILPFTRKFVFQAPPAPAATLPS